MILPNPKDLNANDALEKLETEAHRMKAEELAGEAISAARTRLILGPPKGQREKAPTYVFFATLALKLKLKADWSIDTAAIDGKTLFYNPDFINKLKKEEVLAVVAHEVLHPVLDFWGRLQNRHHGMFNIAHDAAINPILEADGFVLPKPHVFPGKNFGPGMDWRMLGKPGEEAEVYYTRLKKYIQKEREKGKGEGEGGFGTDTPGSDPGRMGSCLEPGTKDGKPPSPSETERAQEDWKVAVQQAANAAKQRGNLSAGLGRFIENLMAPTVPWQQVLREFVTRHVKQDLHWHRPNRRFVSQGLYLPSLSGESIGEMVFTFDTSGSMGAEEMTRVGSEIRAILEMYQCKAHILYHDTVVCHHQTWEPGDGPFAPLPHGGGGTSHIPVFQYIVDKALEPECIVCFTDYFTDVPDAPPEYPVLWAITGNPHAKVAWGNQVEVPMV